jgi:DNA invertase Pin-like site-specific DNA recombinase
MDGSFVSYLCVSTDKQGRSGLGIEAQRAAVASYLSGFGAAPLAEFVEIESGKRDDRPELMRALTECRVRKATLGNRETRSTRPRCALSARAATLRDRARRAGP